MPKEMVLDPGFNVDETRGLRAEVRWARQEAGGYVQLATVADELPTEGTVTNGWFVSMDRQACNDLIRFVKRARDQAFGKDQ